MRSQSKQGHGFALGKFLPPHKGHLGFLRFGQECSETFTIMVCSLPTDPIPGELRFAWMKELFPNANVIHLDDPEIPQTPEVREEFWDIWREKILELVPEPIDWVYASEDYGWRLAQELHANFAPVDIDRYRFPTSGTQVRFDPFEQWDYLPAPVRAYYTKRIAILGPESSGKSTMARDLAKLYNTTEVVEYARPMFDAMIDAGMRQKGEYLYDDLSLIARGQMALEDSSALESSGVLICDTDVLTTLTWSDYLFDGKHESWLEAEAMDRDYDLTFVLHPADNAYVQDGQRVMPDYPVREAFFNQLISNLKKANRRYKILRGTKRERLSEAQRMIDRLFEKEKKKQLVA